MATETAEKKKIHQGRNVIRALNKVDMSQKQLAMALGIDQSNISRLLKKEIIEDEMLFKISDIVGLEFEALKNTEEDTIGQIINNFENCEIKGEVNSVQGAQTINNPIEKILQLSEEKTQLYERLLKNEQERNEQLQKLLADIYGKLDKK